VQRRGRLSSIVLVPFLDQVREPRAPHGREKSSLRSRKAKSTSRSGRAMSAPNLVEHLTGEGGALSAARPSGTPYGLAPLFEAASVPVRRAAG
jgi:hypothetical protein